MSDGFVPAKIPEPPDDPAAWRKWANRSADEALAPLAMRLDHVPYDLAPYPDQIRIADFHVSRVLRCAAGRSARRADEIARDEPLIPTPRKVRRSLACAAAKRLSAQPDATLVGAVRATMTPDALDWWGTNWLEGAPEEPERVLAAAHALTAAAGWRQLPWPLEGNINDTRRWDYPERPLQLSTRLELVETKGDVTTAHRLTDSLDLGFESDELAYTAAVCLLGGIRPPLELVVHYPQTGRRSRQMRVDAALLRRGIEVAALAVATELAARDLFIDPLPRRPGPTCRRCPLADDCEPGQNWLAGSGRRRRGFPAPP